MELITSRSNPLLAHMRKLLKSRSYRRTCSEGISDGVKLLEEAIRWQGAADGGGADRGRGLSRPAGGGALRASPQGRHGLPLPHESPSGRPVHLPAP